MNDFSISLLPCHSVSQQNEIDSRMQTQISRHIKLCVFTYYDFVHLSINSSMILLKTWIDKKISLDYLYSFYKVVSYAYQT